MGIVSQRMPVLATAFEIGYGSLGYCSLCYGGPEYESLDYGATTPDDC